MKLLNFLRKLIKDDGFELVDANSKSYIIGKPKKEKPIRLKILDKSLHWKLLINPDLYLGEGYMNGSIVIENGTLTEFLDIALKNIGRQPTNTMTNILGRFRRVYRYITNFNLIGKSKENVAHHYDISEKFYDLFLDEKRQYSCAYFKSEDNTLEEAQNNKIDHIIKKLNIKSGQKILEVGCGWGGMAFEIARQKGCEVKGISLSKNQINYCKKKAKELNLDNQVSFELADYREVEGEYDRIYSVGMFEHVGKKFYNVFFKSINKLLKNDGLFLLHTIGVVDKPSPPNKFINKYIFPGGVCPSLSQIVKPIEKTGLIVADTETLIRHYDKTLLSWLNRFMAKKDLVKDMFDEKFVKMWSFYLASCAAAFRYRDLAVFQLQIVKNFQTAHRTRDYIYS